MNRKIVPIDSCLNLWLDRFAITEVPVSYQIVCGMSAIGTMLRRQVFIDDDEFVTYPNLSAILVGPSGIGKDVIIGAVEDLVSEIGIVPVIAGRTMEYVKAEMLKIVPPACCFTPAGELTAFLGGKDYQKSMVNELTDLLTTKNTCDVSCKSEGRKVIQKPTMTMLAGSTIAWLHKSMPDGSLEGGFLPRFVVLCEEYGTKHVAWVKYSNASAERAKAKASKAEFESTVRLILAKYARATEITPMTSARDFYENWYRNRFKYFSKAVEPYANRSRGQMHKLAMIMGISRGHNYLEVPLAPPSNNTADRV